MKNTMYLYLRMLVIMFISLYTSRIVLQALGAQNFGIYNVVGSIVLMVSFISNSMSISTQRYLSFEIGNKNSEKVSKIFSMSLNVNIILIVLLVIFALTAGDWFIGKYLNVARDMVDVAKIVFFLSVLACCANIIRISYMACIIAYEEFKIFAYLSIVEAAMNLGIAFLISSGNGDRLILYAILMAVMSIAVTLFFAIYCKINLKNVKYSYKWDSRLFKELGSFAGWSALGEISWVAAGSGVNIILNIFVGVLANTARGLSQQVVMAVTKFVNNFQTAAVPRIIKLYAEGNKEAMFALLIRSTRFSVYLLFIFAIPFILEAESVLKIWLGEVPQFAVIFCQWAMVGAIIDTYSNLLAAAAKAHGDIKKYQIVVSLFIFANLPISYLALKLGMKPISVYWIYAILSFCLIFARLKVLKSLVGLPVSEFLYSLLPSLLVLAMAFLAGLGAKQFFSPGFQQLVIVTLVTLATTGISGYIIGLNKDEKQFLKKQLTSLRAKLQKK